MLKNLDPLLNADVLHALRAMGHGDEVVICDANFPGDSVARESVTGKLLRLDGVDAPRAIRALLSVLPLDTFVDDAAIRMEIVGQPQEVPPVQPLGVEAPVPVRAGRAPTAIRQPWSSVRCRCSTLSLWAASRSM